MNFSITETHRHLCKVLIVALACAAATSAFAQTPADALQTGLPGADATAMVAGATGAAMTALPQSGTAETAQGPPLNSTLLAEPIYGPAPLTVDFFASLANPQPSLIYQWDFGDGAVSSLPSGAYMPHVYQRPGTYLCLLTLLTPQGRSTTLATTVVVRPSGN